MNSYSAIPVSFPDVPRRLRVCIVTETYPAEVNGVAMTMERIVRSLLARGHRIQLIRPQQSATDTPSYRAGLEVEPQPGLPIPFYRNLRLGLPAGAALERLWRQEPPDLVHVITEGPLSKSALRIAGHHDLTILSDFHTNFHHYSSHYRLGFLRTPIIAYLRRFHNRTRCTLVPTQELVNQLQDLGFHNLRVLARGVDTQMFSPHRRSLGLRRSWGARPDTPVVLYVGRLAAEKNLALAVEAFQSIRHHRPEARFVLVGDGPLAAELRAQHPQFIFAGMRKGEDLAMHYASADIFLFPSLTETFGNVTLEAMASGLAVVAFDYAAAHQHLRHNKSGLSVAVGDVAAFVEAARDLAGNLVRTREIGWEARRAIEPFDWERICDQLEGIYLEFLA
jgi:glycosyltransferase involved in cell wall biosynthesis